MCSSYLSLGRNLQWIFSTYFILLSKVSISIDYRFISVFRYYFPFNGRGFWKSLICKLRLPLFSQKHVVSPNFRVNGWNHAANIISHFCIPSANILSPILLASIYIAFIIFSSNLSAHTHPLVSVYSVWAFVRFFSNLLSARSRVLPQRRKYSGVYAHFSPFQKYVTFLVSVFFRPQTPLAAAATPPPLVVEPAKRK